MSRFTRGVTLLIAFLLSSTAAGECRDVPEKVLLYKAIDAMRAAPVGEVHEPAILSYAEVIRDGDPETDTAAIDLSCALLLQMLKRADRFESDSELYSACPAEAVNLVSAENGGENLHEYLPLVRVAPVYPAKALRREATGVVVFQLTVSEEGRVVDERILASTDRMFDKSARNAVRKFRYLPRTVDGIPQATPGVVMTITFSIMNSDGQTLPPYTREQECD